MLIQIFIPGEDAGVVAIVVGISVQNIDTLCILDS